MATYHVWVNGAHTWKFDSATDTSAVKHAEKLVKQYPMKVDGWKEGEREIEVTKEVTETVFQGTIKL